MDAGLTIRPNAGVSPTAAIARPAATPAPAQQTVPTDLPAAKTVTAAPQATSLRTDLARTNAKTVEAKTIQNNVTRDVTFDPQTREVVYKVIDSRSRQVVRQVPSEALLRMRAYTRSLAQGRTPLEALADFEA
jgi:uncharacterized FlaG/YvyC family protein